MLPDFPLRRKNPGKEAGRSRLCVFFIYCSSIAFFTTTYLQLNCQDSHGSLTNLELDISNPSQLVLFNACSRLLALHLLPVVPNAEAFPNLKFGVCIANETQNLFPNFKFTGVCWTAQIYPTLSSRCSDHDSPPNFILFAPREQQMSTSFDPGMMHTMRLPLHRQCACRIASIIISSSFRDRLSSVCLPQFLV